MEKSELLKMEVPFKARVIDGTDMMYGKIITIVQIYGNCMSFYSDNGMWYDYEDIEYVGPITKNAIAACDIQKGEVVISVGGVGKTTAASGTIDSKKGYFITEEKFNQFVRDGLISEKSANIILSHLNENNDVQHEHTFTYDEPLAVMWNDKSDPVEDIKTAMEVIKNQNGVKSKEQIEHENKEQIKYEKAIKSLKDPGFWLMDSKS